jgi:hypothetical protein
MLKKIFCSTQNKKITLTGLDNQDGQIAIFIALIFQILFIFFAMLINVGLIVHDKINLQNSVDLAAYYGAERQAELLNEIAHINYQIRQDYKLLAWRNRILGPYDEATNSSVVRGPPPADTDVVSNPKPAICVGHAGWQEIYDLARNDPLTMCEDPEKNLNPIPPFSAPAGYFIPLVNDAQAFFANLSAVGSAQCQKVGPTNWFYASLWLYSYKLSVSRRAKVIRDLATQLSVPGKDMTDHNGLRVIDGVFETLKRNLTDANRSSLSKSKTQTPDFEFVNSLSSDIHGSGCDTPNADGSPQWIHDNRIQPMVMYGASTAYGNGNSGCKMHSQFVQLAAYGPGQFPGNYPPSDPNVLANLQNVISGEPPPSSTNQPYSSLGFEKNPWCLAYVGVKAKTKPRKPFAPFGTAISLEARAFASPFGGRIGPWIHSKWSPGGLFSDAGAPLVDPNANPRKEDASGTPDYDHVIPNYSRYPGDTVGLRSKLAHYVFYKALLQSALPPAPGSTVASIHLKLYDYWHLLFQDFDGDLLPQASLASPPNPSGMPVTPILPTGQQLLRSIEAAAVAPDLFDITYYSIDADFYKNYSSNIHPAPGTGLYSDIGASQGNNSPDKFWNIKDQMKMAKARLANLNLPGVNWLVPNLDYLLTGWTQGKAGQYPTDPDQFAQCSVHPNYSQNWPAVPGYCVVGGRTGYSVRLISRHYLNNPAELGGAGTKAKIQNPPPSNW